MTAGISRKSEGIWSAGKGLDLHLDQTNERATEVGPLPAAAIDHHADADDFAAPFAHDIDRFLDAAAAGYDIFRDDEALVRRNDEAAPQDEPARFFLGKDMAFA